MRLGRSVSRSDAVLLGSAATLILALLLASTLTAPKSLDERARSIEGQLRCPTCQGLSIADSPATSAAQMRGLVAQQLAAGAGDDEVRAFFVARYGRWILLDPPLSGPDIALWIAPAAALAIGSLLLVRRARSAAPIRTRPRWRAIAPGPVSRASTAVVAVGMAFALTIPIASGLGPRLAGAQVSGGAAPQATPSIEDLEAFVRAEPRDVEGLVALGNALLAASRQSEAADRFKAALEVDATNVDALLGIGTILLGAGRPDAAGPVFDRILAVAPDQPDALLLRATARFQLDGMTSEAARVDVERFLAITPANDSRRTMALELLSNAPSASPEPPDSASPRTPLP